MRVRDCDAVVRAGRMRKAEQFLAVALDTLALADQPEDVGDAAVSLFVDAGIAAADVICCARLGQFSIDGNHSKAIALLESANPEAATLLSRLLGMKSKAQYTSRAVSAAERTSAERAAGQLVVRARLLN